KGAGAGSCGVAAAFAGRDLGPRAMARPWAAPELTFAVREPFPSKSSQASLICGRIAPPAELHLRSLMPEGGVIFSDGIEADNLAFTAGMEAVIGLSQRQGRLVV